MKRRDFVLGSAAGAGTLISSSLLAQARPCTLPTLGVAGGTSTSTNCSQSGSPLADTIRAMTPGSWAAMTPSPANLSATLGVGSSTGNMIPYCNAGAWNPVSRRIEIVAQDHYWGDMRHVQYDEVTNAFIYVGDLVGSGIGHGYDHCEVNPFNGDLYYKAYRYGDGGRIWRKPSGGSWDSGFATVPAFQQVAMGCCWWKGPLTGGGAQGAFLIYNCAVGEINGYNPASGGWFTQTGIASASTYHAVMAYSAVKNVAVFGGGNGQTRRVWKMTSNRAITELTSAPSGCEVGIYAGGLVCDPVSGNFLVLSGGSIWQLNPDGNGTWTQQTGSRVPPGSVSDPAANEHMIMCELPEHGAIAVVSMITNSGTMHLYKHA